MNTLIILAKVGRFLVRGFLALFVAELMFDLGLNFIVDLVVQKNLLVGTTLAFLGEFFGGFEEETKGFEGGANATERMIFLAVLVFTGKIFLDIQFDWNPILAWVLAFFMGIFIMLLIAGITGAIRNILTAAREPHS